MPPTADEVHIKYEALEESNLEAIPRSPSLKRRVSTDQIDSPEKRQRVEVEAAEPTNDMAIDMQDFGLDACGFDFATLVNDIAASVPQKSHTSEGTNIASHSENVNQVATASDPANDPSQAHQLENGHSSSSEALPQHDSTDMQKTAQRQKEKRDIAKLQEDPQLSIRILSLPILESLSLQILEILSEGPYDNAVSIVMNKNTPRGQAYQTLKGLFDTTKHIYNDSSPFLDADELNIRDYNQRTIIRVANLATFVSCVFGGQDVGFYDLNKYFINVWTPEGRPFSKASGQLLLNLKTQIFVAAISQEEQDKTNEETIADIFMPGLAEFLAGRHDFPLTTDELQFVRDIEHRKEYLLQQGNDPVRIKELGDLFNWETFLKSTTLHLESYKPFILPYLRKHSLSVPDTSPQSTTDGNQANGGHNLSENDAIAAEAERAAQMVLQSFGYNSEGQYQQSSQQNSYHPPPQPQSYPAPAPHPPQATYQAFYQSTAATPHHTQSESTSALYDKARQAAAAKNNPGQKARPGLPSQRRPWSTEEENALMAGLDTVKGPHWSQILALYGSKGTVSEVLKDRNQVQLKDKARNLKLFFLKSNIEVPYYLQCVTGELKTRAPSQAARKEAEERARLSGDEEAARFHGVMALASGMQSQSQSHLAQTMNAGGNATPYQRTPTPVSTAHHSPHSSPETLHVVEPEQAQRQEGQVQQQQQAGDVRLEEMNTEDRLVRALSGV
ncbi:myb dna binding protein [Rutstroemia sp. NJR-2017a BBW]|nr:myb dna binding protein [Rutstroemia sp. NJR-2017a BBW]